MAGMKARLLARVAAVLAAAAAAALLAAAVGACDNPVFLAVVRLTAAMQPPDSTYWVKTYGGASYDTGNKLLSTADGGFVLAGTTRSFGSGLGDIWLLKFGADAGLVWQYAYGTLDDESFGDLCLAPDGGYVLVGNTSTASEYLGWAMKVDSSGAVSWSKRFPGLLAGGDYSSFRGVEPLSGGGFLVTGAQQFDDSGTIHNDMWLLKLDSSGNSVGQWRLDDGLFGSESGYDAIPTTDGGVAIAGSIIGGAVPASRIWVVKLSSSMAISWQEYLANADSENATSIQQTADGGFAVFGRTRYPSATRYDDIWINKLTGAGSLSWSRAYGSVAQDNPGSLFAVSGGYVMSGRFQSASDGSGGDGIIVAVDEGGAVLWQKTCGGNLRDSLNLIPWGGGFLGSGVTGYVVATPPTTGDLWLLKLDPTAGPSYASASLSLGQTGAATSVDTTGSVPTATTGIIATTAIAAVDAPATRVTTIAAVAQLYP
ncbi:MAG: hypothetical protein JNG85_05240 [Spirochaetaceae bacterium]|nr:hypothetical protein [Spirochaetaceae bacterium]